MCARPAHSSDGCVGLACGRALAGTGDGRTAGPGNLRTSRPVSDSPAGVLIIPSWRSNSLARQSAPSGACGVDASDSVCRLRPFGDLDLHRASDLEEPVPSIQSLWHSGEVEPSYNPKARRQALGTNLLQPPSLDPVQCRKNRGNEREQIRNPIGPRTDQHHARRAAPTVSAHAGVFGPS